MKRPTIGEVIGSALFAAVLLTVLWAFGRLTDDCEQRHGILVKTITGYACVRLVPK